MRRLVRPLGMRIPYRWMGERRATVEMPNGRSIKLCDVGQNYLAFELHWKGWTYLSPFTALTTRELLREADTFFDIGANIGYYALLAASEKQNVEITAFEPNSANFQLLATNAAANGSRINCVKAAVSDLTGTQCFHIPKSHLSGSLEPSFNRSVERTQEVKTYRIDDYIAENPIPGRLLIKMIIEGHEPKALLGALGTLDDHRPDLVMAISKPWDDASHDLLRNRGYRFYRITNRGLLPVDRLVPCLEGRWLFIEQLATTRSAHDMAEISRRLQPQFSAINIWETNTNRPDLEGRTIW